jgi:hypothetical protein
MPLILIFVEERGGGGGEKSFQDELVNVGEDSSST